MCLHTQATHVLINNSTTSGLFFHKKERLIFPLCFSAKDFCQYEDYHTWLWLTVLRYSFIWKSNLNKSLPTYFIRLVLPGQFNDISLVLFSGKRYWFFSGSQLMTFTMIFDVTFCFLLLNDLCLISNNLEFLCVFIILIHFIFSLGLNSSHNL